MLWERLDFKKMEREIPAPNPRQFIIVFAVVSIFLFLWWRQQQWSYVFIVIFLSLFVAAFVCPQIFRGPAKYWHRFGLFLSWLTSPIILGLMYFITIVPTAMFLKIINHQSLAKRGRWVAKEKKCKFDRSF